MIYASKTHQKCNSHRYFCVMLFPQERSWKHWGNSRVWKRAECPLCANSGLSASQQNSAPYGSNLKPAMQSVLNDEQERVSGDGKDEQYDRNRDHLFSLQELHRVDDQKT